MIIAMITMIATITTTTRENDYVVDNDENDDNDDDDDALMVKVIRVPVVAWLTGCQWSRVDDCGFLG